MQAPTFTIATNAGFDGALVLGKLLEQDDYNLGYDAAKGLFLKIIRKPKLNPLKIFTFLLAKLFSGCFHKHGTFD